MIIFKLLGMLITGGLFFIIGYAGLITIIVVMAKGDMVSGLLCLLLIGTIELVIAMAFAGLVRRV